MRGIAKSKDEGGVADDELEDEDHSTTSVELSSISREKAVSSVRRQTVL